MAEKKKTYLHCEQGNITIMSTGLLVIILFFFAFMVDMGLYYDTYKSISRTVELPGITAKQMVTYYAYESNLNGYFRNSVYKYMDLNHLERSKLTETSVTRQYKNVGGNFVVVITTKVGYEDSYDCIFLPIIGINQIPIRVFDQRQSVFDIGQPYQPGGTLIEWSRESESEDEDEDD